MKYKYPLATESWGVEELNAIKRVIDSKMYSMGQEVSTFEKQFAKKFGSKYALMVNSGSSANLIMIAALFYSTEYDLKEGDEVIVPAVSWSTTYYPLYQYKLKIKFVDIDIKTLNYDIEKLEAAISKKTKLILAVNLLGNPNDFDRISDLASQYNIPIVEDNCESMGAVYRGKLAGTFGVMGTFSTFFSHHIATMEGGIVVTDNEELYHIMLSLRAHGWTRNLPVVNRVTGVKSTDPFDESFKFVLPGYNLRPIEMSGAVGQSQLDKLDRFVEIRRDNAEEFKGALRNRDDLLSQQEIGESSWFGFSIMPKYPEKLPRRLLIEKLNRLGFEVRPIVAGNFVKNPVVKYFNYEIFGTLENADYLHYNGLFIGNNHVDIKDGLKKICDL